MPCRSLSFSSSAQHSPPDQPSDTLSLSSTSRDIAGFLPDCAVLLKRLIRDERVPQRAKLPILLIVPYLASPLDVIPDFIPVLGQLDDAVLVALVLRRVVRVAGRDVVEELWPGSERGLRAVLSLAR
jgi:uncharacterized membrane protein YkvA (DUF1232 family)